MKKIISLIFCIALTVCPAFAQRPAFDSKNPDVHDPVMAKGEDGRYYIFSTGMGISVMSSDDRSTWRQEPSVFKFPEGIPQWASDSIRGFKGHIWAPDIQKVDGKWYLYYSISTFGKNRSAIGLATNKTLDPNSPDFKWEDQGMVIASHQHQDNWNAIDPNLAIDQKTKTPYLVFGSFWDGIQIVKLAKDLKTPIGQPRTIARKLGKKLTLAEVDDPAAWTIEGGDTIEAGENAIEAPFIIYKEGYYYLFVSTDYCCRGQNSTYKTVYGRSKNITGPYVDHNSKDMAFGGGMVIAEPDTNYFGIGHCSAYEFGSDWYFVSHGYSKADNGRAKLFLHPLDFSMGQWINLRDY